MKRIFSLTLTALLLAGCASSSRFSNLQESKFKDVTFGYCMPDSSLAYVIVSGQKYDSGPVLAGAKENWENYKNQKVNVAIKKTEVVLEKKKTLWEKLFESLKDL